MRVTSSLMSKSYLKNLNHNTKKVFKYQEQLSTLNEVNRPSDDPMAVSKILDLNNSISQNEHYQSTIEDSIDWTNMQDSALANATNSMQRIRTLTQSAANGTMNNEDRQAVKSEIEAEIGTLVDSLNTNFGGRYVFAGQHTTTVPFEVTRDDAGEFTGISYNGNEANLPREIAPGVTVELKTDGSQLANGTDGDLGNFFKDVLTALDEGNTDDLGGTLLEQADNHLDNILNTRTEIGAIYNRLQSSKERNESENLNLKETLSTKQDIDLAEKFMEYSMEMVSYEASLQMGTRILQTNILNYL